MNRRGFLKLIGLAGAAVAAGATGVVELDPEKALWVPGRKTIIDLGGIRPVDVDWSSAADITGFTRRYNNLFDIDWVSRETLRLLEKQLTLAKRMSGGYYDTEFKVGDRIVIATRPIDHR